MIERVTINSRGVITIPRKMLAVFGLKADDELILETVDQGLLFRPSVSVPLEFYSEARIAEFAEEDEAIGKLLSDEQ